MKLSEISNREQLAQERAQLMQQLSRKERRLRHSADVCRNRWRRLLSLPSIVSSAVQYIMPSFSAFSFVRNLFRRKR